MDCDVIKDLLPLYIDGACSEGTEKSVKEHLEQCDTCREIYEKMSFVDDVSQFEVENIEEVQPFKKIKEKQRKKYGILVSLLLICLIVSVILLLNNIREERNQLFFEVATGDFNKVLQRVDEEIENKWGIDENVLLELSGNTGLVFGPATGMYFRLFANGKQFDVSCTYNGESQKTLVYVNYRRGTGVRGYGANWNQLLMQLDELETEGEIIPQSYVLLVQFDTQGEKSCILNIYEYEPGSMNVNNSETIKISIPAISTEILE